MTEDEKRLALMSGACPECGHGILNHRRGVCRVIVTVTPGREPVKKHCGCLAIRPPNTEGMQIVMDELALITKEQIEYLLDRKEDTRFSGLVFGTFPSPTRDKR